MKFDLTFTFKLPMAIEAGLSELIAERVKYEQLKQKEIEAILEQLSDTPGGLLSQIMPMPLGMQGLDLPNPEDYFNDEQK